LLEDPSDEEEAEEVIDEVFDAIGIELNSKVFNPCFLFVLISRSLSMPQKLKWERSSKQEK